MSDSDLTLIRCSNMNCPFKRWYHVGCIPDLDEAPALEEDWWCNVECKETGSSTACICKKVKDGPYVLCASRDECDSGIKFHLECLGFTETPGMLKKSCFVQISLAIINISKHIQRYASA